MAAKSKQSVKEPATAIPVEPGREPQVAKEPKESFDERTSKTQPFVDENGQQVTGGDGTETAPQEPSVATEPADEPDEAPADEPTPEDEADEEPTEPSSGEPEGDEPTPEEDDAPKE